MVRLVLKRRPSAKNPSYCDVCETFVRTHPGGAEVEISMLFSDVRGSTTLAEQMRPAEFSRLMNRFFDSANRVVIDSDGLVDKRVGDEVVALYVPPSAPTTPKRRSRPRATYCARRRISFRLAPASTSASHTSAPSAPTSASSIGGSSR
jgi:class 3 adenylate cyclase